MRQSPIFKRQHYRLIAKELKMSREVAMRAELPLLALTVERFADLFAADNDRFDRGRFLAACGIEQ